MVIVFGAGNLGQHIVNNFLQDLEDLLYYDNDRRKWGTKINGIPIINFDQFLNLISKEDTEIILGTQNETAIFFLKDACSSKIKISVYRNNVLEPFDLNQAEKFERNFPKLEKEKLAICEKRKKDLMMQGNIPAYNHALNYIRYKRNNPSTPEIRGIELTNNCNLKCPNCPTPTSERDKGFMDYDVFDLTLKLVSPCPSYPFSIHGLGEPLLHPYFIEYLEKIVELDIATVISTNGILLEGKFAYDVFHLLKKMSNVIFYVSFHTPKSVENWYNCIDLIKNANNINFYGQVLEHNIQYAEDWLSEMGIKDPKHHPYIRYISSHSFAGNVEGRKTDYHKIEISNRIRNCSYLKSNTVEVAWNGILKNCCFDSECEGTCGTIFDFDNARVCPDGYKLCKNCDPDWNSNYQ